MPGRTPEVSVGWYSWHGWHAQNEVMGVVFSGVLPSSLAMS